MVAVRAANRPSVYPFEPLDYDQLAGVDARTRTRQNPAPDPGG